MTAQAHKNNNAFQHDSIVAWPNGAGYTPCTATYTQTVDALYVAQLAEATAEDALDWPARERHGVQALQLESQLDLLREQGHLGEPVTLATPSPEMALAGGAQVTADGLVHCGDLVIGQLSQSQLALH